ncbi:MAG: M1 family metallopeptidase [Promethearchaeota archaeon]
MPQLSSNGDQFSQYNISVIFNETTSSVTGNLSVNYYNNDPINITRIPFHLFLSGMLYQTRMGQIDILNVSTLSEPKKTLNFSVNEPSQLLWVNLTSDLEPNNRAFFQIEFNSIIPDGGFDRANSNGSDDDYSRIFKFTSFYPMPCVYDKYDEWNTDPYLDVGDPFYHEMAYYNILIEAPNGVVVTATGDLINRINKGATTVYHFDPLFPVREITFAASRWYEVQSSIVNGVNISTYYLPKSSFLWENDALNYAMLAFDLFNDTFGFYPYSTLNIVEEYALYLGMEYPTQVYASEIIDRYNYPVEVRKQILEKAIVHEIAHQWWYNLVGFDEVDWGFLDEGLTCWSTDYYARFYYNDWTRFQWTRYFDRVRTYYATEHLTSKINQSAYELIKNNLNWVYISYYKSPLIFEKIYRTIGQSNFLLGLSTFFEQYLYKIAELSDFQHVLENLLSESLDWLFFPWFDNDFIPNYSFLTCSYDETEYNLTVIIQDQNEILYDYYPYMQQATLQVYDSSYSLIYNQLVWINSTTTFSLGLIDPILVRLEYGNDVIVQLTSPSVTYIETTVTRTPRYTPISGYTIHIILVVCLLSIVYLIYGFLTKKKNYSKK